MNDTAGAIGSAVVGILMAVIGVAVIAVIISSKAQTASVLQAGGNAFSTVLGSALSPVTGGGIGGTLGNVGNSLLGAA